MVFSGLDTLPIISGMMANRYCLRVEDHSELFVSASTAAHDARGPLMAKEYEFEAQMKVVC